MIGRLGASRQWLFGRVFLLGVATSLAGCAAGPGAPALRATAPQAAFASPAAMRAHMGFLAADDLRGRKPGTPGFDIAARYVASQFELAGAKPAGAPGSYLQPVPLVRYRATGEQRLGVQLPGRKPVELVLGKDFRFRGWPMRSQVALSAPLAFGGFGVVAPRLGRDDLAGLDVAGKVVVVIGGGPDSLRAEGNDRYLSDAAKREALARRGAAGMIVVASLVRDDSSASTPANPATRAKEPAAGTPVTAGPWSLTWRGPSGRPGLRGGDVVPVAQVVRSGMEALLAGGPITVDQIQAAARRPEGRIPAFSLPAVVRFEGSTEIAEVPSENIAGLIEGSDPARRDELIVLTAHLDHLGTLSPDTGDAIAGGVRQLTPTKGDGIFNGALDNASGVATLLEVARGFRNAPTRPRRSVLLLALTGEEDGLVGSNYFVHNLPLPGMTVVADVNLDMPILTYDFQDIVALGADRSSMMASVERAAARVGVRVSPTPANLLSDFARSDQYSFAEQGIPAVFLRTGFANGGQAAWEAFENTCYHRVCDDMSQPIDWRAAAKFADLNYEIARNLADAPDRPRWNAGSASAAPMMESPLRQN